MGFIYNAAIVIVTYYFNKKRGVATACAVSGTGAGTFIYPLYMEAVRWCLGDLIGELRAYLVALLIGYVIIVIIGYFYVDIRWTSDTPKAQIRAFDKKVKSLLDEQDTNTRKKKVFLRHAISLPNLNMVRADAGSIISLQEAASAKKVEMMPARSKSVALFENQRPMINFIPEYTMMKTGLEHLEHLDLEVLLLGSEANCKHYFLVSASQLAVQHSKSHTQTGRQQDLNECRPDQWDRRGWLQDQHSDV